VKVGLAEQ